MRLEVAEEVGSQVPVGAVAVAEVAPTGSWRQSGPALHSGNRCASFVSLVLEVQVLEVGSWSSLLSEVCCSRTRDVVLCVSVAEYTVAEEVVVSVEGRAIEEGSLLPPTSSVTPCAF